MVLALHYFNKNAVLYEQDEFFSILSKGEQLNCLKAQHPVVKQERLLSYALLRLTLAKHLSYLPGDLQIQRPKGKKPFLIGGKKFNDIFFNVSHSRDWITIALTEDCPVGIDIEAFHILQDQDSFMHRNFSTNEMVYIKSSLNSERRFYEVWTRKEAYLKYLGLGIVKDLSAIDTKSAKDLHLVDFVNVWSPKGYACALCVSKAQNQKVKISIYQESRKTHSFMDEWLLRSASNF